MLGPASYRRTFLKVWSYLDGFVYRKYVQFAVRFIAHEALGTSPQQQPQHKKPERQAEPGSDRSTSRGCQTNCGRRNVEVELWRPTSPH